MFFFIEKILPIIIIGFFVFIGYVLIVAVTWDWKGDRANLLVCADEYRACIKRGGETCMRDVGTCRKDYGTSREEWAKILGNAETLRQIDSGNETHNAAMTGAMIGGLIGRSGR